MKLNLFQGLAILGFLSSPLFSAFSAPGPLEKELIKLVRADDIEPAEYTKNLNEAITLIGEFRKAASEPKAFEIYWAESQFRLKNHLVAFNSLSELLKQDRYNIEALTLRGQVALEFGEKDDSIAGEGLDDLIIAVELIAKKWMALFPKDTKFNFEIPEFMKEVQQDSAGFKALINAKALVLLLTEKPYINKTKNADPELVKTIRLFVIALQAIAIELLYEKKVSILRPQEKLGVAICESAMALSEKYYPTAVYSLDFRDFKESVALYRNFHSELSTRIKTAPELMDELDLRAHLNNDALEKADSANERLQKMEKVWKKSHLK